MFRVAAEKVADVVSATELALAVGAMVAETEVPSAAYLLVVGQVFVGWGRHGRGKVGIGKLRVGRVEAEGWEEDMAVVGGRDRSLGVVESRKKHGC